MQNILCAQTSNQTNLYSTTTPGIQGSKKDQPTSTDFALDKISIVIFTFECEKSNQSSDAWMYNVICFKFYSWHGFVEYLHHLTYNT